MTSCQCLTLLRDLLPGFASLEVKLQFVDGLEQSVHTIRRSIKLLFWDWVPNDDVRRIRAASIWLLWSKHRILAEDSLVSLDALLDCLVFMLKSVSVVTALDIAAMSQHSPSSWLWTR
mgnify:CR=1 FL=1